LSVCYIAFSNLDGFRKYWTVKAPNLMVMIASLGLIHGLGLSTRLQQLPLNQDQLLMNIISFNIGIELGQIIALSVMLFVLSGVRQANSWGAISLISNQFLIFSGMVLFLFQMHGYQHTAYPDEFPLNKDDHYHVHEKMGGSKPSALGGYQKRLGIDQSKPAPTKPSTHSHGKGPAHTH